MGTNRSAKSNTTGPEAVVVRYDLHALPTAQHKAGLAGLLLQIESMNERRRHGATLPEPPQVLDLGPTHAEVRFTAESTQALFDDLYDAEVVEIRVKNKWSGKPPKRIEEVAVRDDGGRTAKEKWFIYDVERPTGAFLARYTDDGKEVWHKLWRDMLWAIPRGKPTTRGPFKARAAGEPTREGANVWKALVADEKARRKGQRRTVEVAGAVLLGAQAVSAENVKFEDLADHALLLHFWQLTARVFVPERINADGNREFIGYVLAIPEVCDLQEFCNGYTRGLALLSPERRGYRPAEAVITLPEQGALEFMRNLADLVQQQEVYSRPQEYLSGIEFHHMVKEGNNIKSLTSGRVPPKVPLLNRYRKIKAANRNPLMLAGRLRALLADQPWFAGLNDDLLTRDWSFFVHAANRTPPGMIGFAYEAANGFEEVKRITQTLEVERMRQSEEGGTTVQLANSLVVDRVIYRLVGQYVRERALAQLGIAAGDPQWWEKTHDPKTGRERLEYQEARMHVASQLFLALRSRQADEFVQHFTAALGSVAQYLPEDDYAAVSAALMRSHTDETGDRRPRTRDDVKTLTLLALSAHSRSLSARAETTDVDEGTTAEEES